MRKTNSNKNIPSPTVSAGPSGREKWKGLSTFALLLGGGALALYAWKRRSGGGTMLASAAGLVGAAALARPSARRRAGQKATSRLTLIQGRAETVRGTRVEKTVSIHLPVEVVYRRWRELSLLPEVMPHLVSVEVLDAKRSRWTAKAPFGRTVQWVAETVEERENEFIEWRSLKGSDVDQQGMVCFHWIAEKNLTELKALIYYRPPGGKLGTAIAKLMGQNPETQIREDLRQMKQYLETDEIPELKP